MANKRLQECQYFFVDSGVLIDLIKIDISNSSQEVQSRIIQTRKLFNALNNPDGFGKRKLVFQISAITIAEIFHTDDLQSDTIKVISTAINSQQVEVYAFDYETAIFHNLQFHDILSKKEIDKMQQQINYPKSLYANIRDRIRKDIMIAATAKLYRSDIVLTNDKGFKSLCGELGLPCHILTDNENQFVLSADGNEIYDFAP